MQRNRRHSAEVRSAVEGTVAEAQWRYAVQQKAQCGGTQCSGRHSAEVRSVVEGVVRSCAGQTRKNCGSFIKHLLAVFYLLLKSSGFRLLVLLIWLLNSEKLLVDSLVD